MKTYSYLATPYHDKDPRVMEERYCMAKDAVYILMQKGFIVFSPIVHCHDLARTFDLPKSFVFWSPYNFAMLRGAHEFIIYDSDPAWLKSEGIAKEKDYADTLALPCRFYSTID